jgi:hypothetical protein
MNTNFLWLMFFPVEGAFQGFGPAAAFLGDLVRGALGFEGAVDGPILCDFVAGFPEAGT